MESCLEHGCAKIPPVHIGRDQPGKSSRCHCATCHETFSTPRAFDMHRPITGPCRPPGEVGLVKSDAGIWHQPAYGRDIGATRSGEI